MINILDFFPAGLTPRPAQVGLLRQIEDSLALTDVLVLACPPASGKTEIALTIAHWLAAQKVTVNYLGPDNMLVQQTDARYPMLVDALYRKDMYQCTGTDSPDCRIGECDCSKHMHHAARERARKARVRLMNTHVYRANRMYAPVAIFDEAHKIRDLMEDERPARLWCRDWDVPLGLQTVADVLVWGQEYLKRHPYEDRLRRQLVDMGRVHQSSTVAYCQRMRARKMEPVLEVRPCLQRAAADKLWPHPVTKIVLMSATIGPKDIEELGLDRRRVTYLHCDSPIPAAQRPVVYKPVCNMGFKFLDAALPVLADELMGLLGREPGKGLIHLPYGLAKRMRPLLSHERLIWHDKLDKQDALSRFRAMPPESGAVLVASGLYEGVDLPFDDDSWQVLGKVPYLSLADDAIKAKLKEDPDWYDWQAIKLLLQAYGRLPRRPDGRGTTYIFDMAYKRLLKADEKRPVRMFPAHYLAATEGGT